MQPVIDTEYDPELIELGDHISNDLGEIEVDWENPPKLSELKRDLESAIPAQQKQTRKIDEYLDNLYVRNGAEHTPKKKTQSKIVPKVIRRQAEWRYSSLTEPLLSRKDLFTFSPKTWEDKGSAEQNQLVLNQQWNWDIDKEALIDEYVRTGVNQGTIILRTGWEFQEETVKEEQPTFTLTHDPSFAETLQEIQQLQQSNPNGFETDVPFELKEALKASLENQAPMRPHVTGTKVVDVLKTIVNRPTVTVCHYANVFVDPTCNGDTDKARFIIYSYESSEAELRKDGRYFNLDRLKNRTQEGLVSDQDHTVVNDEYHSFEFEDKPRKRLIVKEYWGFWDIHGTGELEPFVASWVDNVLVQLELNPFPDKELPFVWVKYMPKDKELYGEPDGALLVDQQAVMGAVMRGMIDIMARSSNAQTGRVRNALDAANRRKFEQGEDYEVNGNTDPSQMFYMHKFEELPNSSQYMLQLMNAEAESLTGVKAFSGGLDGAQLGDVATAVRGVLDSASKRELGILRRLAKGLIKVARKFSSMNAEFLSEEEVVRITNDQFVKVRRGELAGKYDLSVTISTAEEDDAKAREIAFILQAAGDTIDKQLQQFLLSEILKLRKMPDIAKTVAEYQPPPDPFQQQMQQLEMEKLQMEIAVLQSQATENNAEAQLDYAKADELSAAVDQAALDYVEQESGVKQERDLQKQKAQAQGNIQLEHVKQGYRSRDNIQKSRQQQEDTLLKAYLERQKTSF